MAMRSKSKGGTEMQRAKLAGVLTVASVLGLAVFLAAAGKDEHRHHHDMKGQHVCPMKIEGAQVNIENIADGVIIRITSRNKETIKTIQEAALKMKAHRTTSTQDTKKEVWVCPMGCYEGPKTNDGRCPKCGMNLEKKSP